MKEAGIWEARQNLSALLRTPDALHITLALAMEAQFLVTFDCRMADAAALYGLEVVELS